MLPSHYKQRQNLVGSGSFNPDVGWMYQAGGLTYQYIHVFFIIQASKGLITGGHYQGNIFIVLKLESIMFFPKLL
jgi:pantothenate synthetase